MKKIYLSILMLGGFVQLQAQDNKTGVIVASEFHVTRPIREIFAENPVDENKLYDKKESEDREHRIAQKFRKTVEDGPEYGNDSKTIQGTMGNIPSIPTRANIAGQTASGFRPFDPSGAVGPNHYIQMINSTTFKIYNKPNGANILTGTLGDLWNPATDNAGDPIVMYDKAADRWFLAQFGSSTDNKIFIAVSTTNDPTGSYYTYTYVSSQFPDYLKFCVWQDGYYMTSNQSTQKVFCFERAAMIAGTPGARSVYVNYSPPKSGFFVPLTGDAADGTLPAPGTPCPIFSYSDNGWGSGYSDAVNIYNMAVNWVPATPTATITLAGNIPTAAFDASYDSNWNDVSQPGTSEKLDGLGGVFMYRAQWKSWSGYNTVLLNWAVKISSTQRSIKWCELRQNTSTGVWSMYQEGIYAPDASTRWIGCIAMDNNGSIGLSYLKANSTSIYPGLYYTGRRSCDPLGTLPVTEAVAIAGTGSQTGGVNRVGDYAQTTLDPDGITFWNTSEYMGGSTGPDAAKTRIFSYQIAPCTSTLAAGVSISLSNGSNPTCTGSSVTFTATPTNGGSTPAYQWKVGSTNVGTNSATYTTTTLTNGQVVTCVMTSNLSGVTGNPAASNAITMSINSGVAAAVSIAITTGSNPSCSGASKTFTATPTNGGTTPSYQWKVSGAVAGSNSATFTTTSLTAGQIVSCVLTSNFACASTPVATSNSITISFSSAVTPSVLIAQTSGSNPSAAGASVTFTATPTNGGTTPFYQWKVSGVNAGTNSATFTTTTLSDGQIVTCVMTSNSACASPASGTSNAITMTITGSSYCGAGTTNLSYEYISNVTMGSINNATAHLSYGDYTSLSTNLAMGSSATITVTNGSPYASDEVIIWCDWNNNGVFTDAGENVFTSAAGPGPFSASITPPVGTTLGAVRMRIRLTDTGSGPNVTSCGNSSYGEVEDYTINVTGTTTATAGVSIALTSGSNPSCTGSSVTFTATPTNGGTTPAYQWKVGGVNAGTNSATYTTASLTNGQVVTCVMTSNLPGVTGNPAMSNAITVTTNSSVTPAVSIALTSGTTPGTSGASVTFTATPTNGGTTPSYQWKVSGANAGTNSATFTTSTLSDGQIVTCVMTSSSICANPATGTSNAITMTITGGTAYCAAGTNTISYEHITNVTMGSINNSSTNSSYTDYSSLSTDVAIGTPSTITVSIGNPYSTDKILIWCDWNNDGDFTDAGESVYTSAAGTGPFSTTINPPNEAISGMVRMRIRCTDSGSGPNVTSCGNSSYGEVEDYSLNVTTSSNAMITGITTKPANSLLNAELLSIYPNPSSGSVTITSVNEGEYYIMDEAGRLVQSLKLNAGNNYSVLVNDLSIGFYIVAGQNKQGISKQKIIVTK